MLWLLDPYQLMYYQHCKHKLEMQFPSHALRCPKAHKEMNSGTTLQFKFLEVTKGHLSNTVRTFRVQCGSVWTLGHTTVLSMASYFCKAGGEACWMLWWSVSTTQRSMESCGNEAGSARSIPKFWKVMQYTADSYTWCLKNKIKILFPLGWYALFFQTATWSTRSYPLAKLLGPNKFIERTIRYFFWPGSTIKTSMEH